MLPIRDNPTRIVPWATVSIIAINTIVLFFQITSPDPFAFTVRWALVPSELQVSEVNSLLPIISAMFLHGDLFHYLSNMWFLWIFGDNVEAAMGRLSFLVLYISGGIAAAIFQLLIVNSLNIPILGASGAIAAILGFYLINFPKNTVLSVIPIFPIFPTIRLPSIVILSFWFVTQLFSGAVSLTQANSGGVAWWAHIGGFVYGFLIGFLFVAAKKRYRFE